MKKSLGKFACFFASALITLLVFYNQPLQSQVSNNSKSMPGIVSLLFDDDASPEPDDTPLPDTGQDECYGNSGKISCPTNPQDDFYGQDAQYAGTQRSYTKLGQDGAELEDNATHADSGGDWIMTRDDVTGLIWEVKTSANKNDKYTWQNATSVFIADLNSSQFGGFTDWRLPTRAELSALSDRSIYNPAIDPFFPNTVSFRYWTNTAVAGNTANAWRVNCEIGFAYYELKTSQYYVRAVRGPAIGNNFVDNNDGTVSDTVNGLMWKICSSGQQWDGNSGTCTGTAELLTWKDALARAAEENNWRLPNINELQTLVNDSASDPAIYAPFGQHLPSSLVSPDPDHDDTLPYWSSTTDVRFPAFDRAWLVDFVDGSNNYDGYAGNQGVKTLEFFVRLVRSVN